MAVRKWILRPVLYIAFQLFVLKPILAEKPIEATYTGDPGQPSGLLLPNPPNATCEVLIGVKLISSGSITQANPGPALTTGSIVMQVESLLDEEVKAPWTLLVDVLPTVMFSSASGASVGPPKAGANGTVGIPLFASDATLGASGIDSTFVNVSVMANTQDIVPREIFLNGDRCSLFLALKASDLG